MEEKRDIEHHNDVGQVSSDHSPDVVAVEDGNQIKKNSVQYENFVDKPTVDVSYTQEEANRVIRKLDWHLMPLIFVLYSLSVLDRANLGNARSENFLNRLLLC